MTHEEALVVLKDMAHGRDVRLGVETATYSGPSVGETVTTYVSALAKTHDGGWVCGISTDGGFEQALADLARQLPHEVPA